ncbi:MAG TPA: hypothetical protein VF181_09960 [Balneolaceae bacterium]
MDRFHFFNYLKCKRRFILLLLISLVTTSCTYSPNGSNFIEISKKVDPIQAEINFSPVFVDADTFKIYSNVRVDYNFELGDKVLRRMQVWFGNDTLIDFPRNGSLNQYHTFSLRTSNYPDGVRKLNFRVLTSSATNSIADLSGAEVAVFEKSWLMEIDNAPPTGVPIISAERKNGSLELRWKMYKRPNFERYLPRRGEYDGKNFSPYVFFNDYRITNRGVTSAFDRLYIGGTAYYRVVISPVDIFPQGYGPVFKFEDEYPQFIKIDTVGSKLRFTWSSCKYPANFGFYRFGHTESGKSWTFTNVADTTFELELPKGGTPQEFWLRTRPADPRDGRTDLIDKIIIQ